MNDKYTVNLSVLACFEYDVKYIGDGLNIKGTQNNNYGNMDAKACQNLCQKTDGCEWFNRNKKGDCYLKKSKGKQENDQDGVSGPKFCDEGSKNRDEGIN